MSCRTRSGSFLLLLILFVGLVVAGGGGFFLWTGQQADKRLRAQIAVGSAAFEKDQHDNAISAFTKALAENGAPLQVFQKLQPRIGQQPQSLDEVRLALGSTYLVKAYDSMMKLRPVPELIASANAVIAPLTGTDTAELKKTLDTAREVSGLCALFEKKQYQQVMKDLLAVEKRALPSDQDFFIMEVRLLIACGKALREQVILKKARELLFFLNFELRIKGPRTDLLWRLLNQ